MQSNPLKKQCKCGATAWERLERRTFLETALLPFFNLYPWRCPLCNRRRYIALRADPAAIRKQLAGED